MVGTLPITCLAIIKVGIQVPTEPNKNVIEGPWPKPKAVKDKIIGISSPSCTYNGIPIIKARKKAKNPEDPIYWGITSFGIKTVNSVAINRPIKKNFHSLLIIVENT